MESLQQRLTESLRKRKKEGTFRSLRRAGGGSDFSSNDYLGLARSKALADDIALHYSRLETGNGSGGSRLITGNSLLADQLEQELAAFFQAESALLFNSGYAANLALISTLPKKGDTILYDELAHACIKDGARLSLAQRFSFKHNEVDSLEKRLKRAQGQVFVAVESVYSMDGDEAPLRRIAALCRQYGAALLVDEAHSTGIYGEGRGLLNELGLQEEVFAAVYTFGKAMGSHGACISGSLLLRNYLINFARPFIYTTAAAPHSLLSLQRSFYFLQQHPQLIEGLKENITFFLQLKKEKLEPLLPAGQQIESRSPVQAIVCPGLEALRSLADKVQRQGFDVRPIVSPTVPQGRERLRICLHNYNTKEEIKALVEALVNAFI